MEIKRKTRTLAGLFLQFAVLFCVNTIFILIAGALLLFFGSAVGLTLPANYAENQLSAHVQQLQSAGMSLENWIPEGCTYGIYDGKGQWLSGNFTEKEQKNAWTQYKNNNNYASQGNYYRTIQQENGNICIVKYSLYMRYRSEKLNQTLPPPERMSFFLDAVLFFVNAILLSGKFAKKINRQLEELRKITEKIAQNDLEFATGTSQIKEINEVMLSFSKMKDALKSSLKEQWDLEQQKKEQLSALTHDIKTPLTIIKGNAELLSEEELTPENTECTDDILENVSNIEQYLERMRQVLYGKYSTQHKEVLSCETMGEKLKDAAMQLAAAEKIPVVFRTEKLNGNIYCNQENILRAWKNVVSNAAEHTDRAHGIEVWIKLCERENQKYMEAVVRDYGRGFSQKDLEYADKEFYSGDASRHNKNHQGLGLAIAKKFLQEQGGVLLFSNHAKVGAEVSCLIKISEV